MLEGDLSDFTLPDILRLLAFTSKTGRLRLESPDAAGRIDLIDGRVRDASSAAGRLPLARRLLGLGVVDGDVVIDLLHTAESLPTDRAFAHELIRNGHAEVDAVTDVLHEQTIDAVFDLLRWSNGSFRFDVGGDHDSSPPDLAVAVDELLEEADRRLAEWSDIEAATGSGDAVVTIAAPRTEGRAIDVDADGWALLAFVDGRRTVDDLVALSGRGQFDTRRTLGALVERGVVRVGDPGAGGTVQRLLAAHRALAEIEVARVGDDRDSPVTSEPVSEPTSGPVPAPATVPARPSQPQPVETQPPVETVGSPLPPAETAGMPPPSADPTGPLFPPAGGAEPRSAPPEPDAPPRPGEPDDDVTPLRTTVRAGRLKTDPTVDAELVSRLIDGVEGL